MVERLPFACVPRWMLADERLAARDVCVFAALTGWADLPDGCRPSQRMIAGALGVSVSSIKRGLARLVDIGVVDVEARYDEAGGRLPNRYAIRAEYVYQAETPPVTRDPAPPVSSERPPRSVLNGPPGHERPRNENEDNETEAHPAPLTTSDADAPDSPKAEATLVYDDRAGDDGDALGPRPVGEIADELCGLLADRIEGNGSAAPFDRRHRPPRRWRDAARLMLTKDGRAGEPLAEPLPSGSRARSPRRVAAAIEWAHRDEFWRANILSMSKLREQYDRLRLQARRQTERPGTAEHAAAQQSRHQQRAAELRAQGR